VLTSEVIRAAVAIGLQRGNRDELLAALAHKPKPERPWTSQRITWLARRLGSRDAQTTQLDHGRYALVYATDETAKALRKEGLSVQSQNGIFTIRPQAVSA
jgi:hypothetical protein